MKVATQRFKEAVNKAIKGAGFNNLIPITSMMGIKLSGGQLKLLTTDMTNTLCIIIDKVSGDDMDITIDAEKFGKLIAKTTSDDIEMSVVDNVLEVRANGKYKLPLITDEDGLVSFNDVIIPDKVNARTKLTSVLSAYNINRSALAKTLETPCLTGYYCGDKVITTDANVITFNEFKMFDLETPVLISGQLMQLLTLNTSEDIDLLVTDTELVFVTPEVVIGSQELEGISEYPVNEISAYLDEAFPSMCKVPKDLLLSVLDRLSLFIEPYDKNGAYFTFGRTGITIHSKKEASTEVINYVASDNFSSFVCCVDIPMLKEQLQANPDDTVELWYGNDNALKLKSGKVTQVIALLEDENIAN